MGVQEGEIISSIESSICETIFTVKEIHTKMKIKSEIFLEGNSIVLIPFEMKYKEQLFEALKSPKVWEYTWREVKTFDDFEQIFMAAIQNKLDGEQIPFVIQDKATGDVIGTTRIGDIDRINRNVEIGWTWLSPSYWRTGVNTECKLLLLQYCFEELQVMRVQFSVSGQNVRSQQAIERIGATKEGIFRKHRIKADGTVHDNVFYSILDDEWKRVKGNLMELVKRKY